MTSRDDVAAGNAEVPVTDASNARSEDVHPDSVRIARAIPTAHHIASSRGWQYHRHPNARCARLSRTQAISLRGAGSVFVITRDTKRWTALRGSCAATVGGAVTYFSCAPISAMRSTTSSCMEREKKAIPSSTATEKVEVEPTSIQKGG